eukprot:TRINITY_DN1635_c0_g1_i1.p1 TRINITY_DN1635_c0_g1~~TRINITY_DN1635_c0_g1_i1.p1  ORF type:complete len:326 (+),score=58.38 TRINITY_DN1635_c0_g1_i1:482-1459(+)
MTTLWFQLAGTQHDETSLRVLDLKQTVDDLKESIIQSNTLELPSSTKKSTIFLYLKKDSDSPRKLSARNTLSELDIDSNTLFVVEVLPNEGATPTIPTQISTPLSSISSVNTTPTKTKTKSKSQSVPTTPNSNEEKRTTKGNTEPTKSEDKLKSEPKKKKKKKEGGGVDPCAHNCTDKRTCGHTCCKIGFTVEELKGAPLPSPNPKKRKHKRTDPTIPCKHTCKDKTKCRHPCCKQESHSGRNDQVPMARMVLAEPVELGQKPAKRRRLSNAEEEDDEFVVGKENEYEYGYDLDEGSDDTPNEQNKDNMVKIKEEENTDDESDSS